MDLNESKYPLDDPPSYEMLFDNPIIQNVPPPPTYEPPQIQGLSDDWRSDEGKTNACDSNAELAFVDFMPSKTSDDGDFQSFGTLMSIVNDWLAKNVQYRVMSVECIDRPLDKNGYVDSEKTIRMKGIYSKYSFVRGVRLWLRPDLEKAAAQKLWYLNVLPKPVPQAFYLANYCGMSMCRYRRGLMVGALLPSVPEGESVTVQAGLGVMQLAHKTIFHGFEDLDDTLAKVNDRLKTEPIPGTVISTACIDMRYAKNYWDPIIFDPFKKPYDPDISVWEVQSQASLLYLTVLRVFYVQGEPQPCQIGLQDFEALPVETDKKSSGRTQYEKNSDVYNRAFDWIKTTKDIKVTNISTVSCVEDRSGDINPRCTSYNSGYGTERKRNVVRVAYVKGSGGPPPQADLASTLRVRTFIPMRYQSRSSESLATLVARTNHWLACSGAQLLCAETVEFYFDPDARRAIDTDRSEVKLPHTSGLYWMTGLVLYIYGDFKEPSAEVCPPIPVFGDPTGAAKQSSCCSVL